MEETLLNPTEWLNMGLGGAALLILAIFIIMFMKSNNGKNNDIQSLCSKIDKLVDSNTETVKTLATTLTQWNIEQKATSSYLERIEKLSMDSTSRLDVLGSKIDFVLGVKKE